MRDLIVTLTVFGSLPWILARPHIGIIVWSWLSYMNPHRLTWGFAYDMPFAQIVGAVTLVAYVISREPKQLPVTALTTVWLIFLAWMCLTTVTAMYPEAAQEQLIKVMKIQLLVLLTVPLVQSRQRLQLLVWVIVVSIGFYGVKGGIFTLTTGGEYRVWGPRGFIEDNNALALALLMILPLANYLRLTTKNRYVRYGLLASMALSGVSIVGSYSRAAFLAALSMLATYWLFSSRKVASALLLVVLLPGLYSLAPESWHERMGTIVSSDDGQYEGSAQSRLDTWKMILNLAADRPILGAGFSPWFQETYRQYGVSSDHWEKTTAAHSIYLSVLAEHGYVGLLLLAAILLLALGGCQRIAARARDDPDLIWLVQFMRMIQISLVGYAVGGTFHQLPYFDLPWHLICMVLIGRVLLEASADPARGRHGDATVGLQRQQLGSRQL